MNPLGSRIHSSVCTKAGRRGPLGSSVVAGTEALDQLKKTRRRRKNQELDEEERARRAEVRRQNDLERRRKIKSQLYVHDSDEESDEEKDREFFARESAIRAASRKSGARSRGT